MMPLSIALKSMDSALKPFALPTVGGDTDPHAASSDFAIEFCQAQPRQAIFMIYYAATLSHKQQIIPNDGWRQLGA
jgi:hypothetical protein